MMPDDPQHEYAEARAAYRAAIARLVEAKRHIPETPRDRRRRLQREERERLRSLPPDPRSVEMMEAARQSLRDWTLAKLQRDIESSLAETDVESRLGDTIIWPTTQRVP